MGSYLYGWGIWNDESLQGSCRKSLGFFPPLGSEWVTMTETCTSNEQSFENIFAEQIKMPTRYYADRKKVRKRGIMINTCDG